MSEEIKENKLIRNFMDHGYSSIRFQYDKSWNDLMPVVEKINKEKYSVSIEATFATNFKWVCTICGTSKACYFVSNPFDNPIDAVWQAVTTFINWYNQNKQP